MKRQGDPLNKDIAEAALADDRSGGGDDEAAQAPFQAADADVIAKRRIVKPKSVAGANAPAAAPAAPAPAQAPAGEAPVRGIPPSSLFAAVPGVGGGGKSVFGGLQTSVFAGAAVPGAAADADGQKSTSGGSVFGGGAGGSSSTSIFGSISGTSIFAAGAAGAGVQEGAAKPAAAAAAAAADTAAQKSDGDAKKKDLPAKVDVVTGEEDEETLIQQRAKLHRQVDGAWKDQGPGTFRLKKGSDGRFRIVMRTEQTHRVLLNYFLWAEFSSSLASEKSLRFSFVDDGEIVHFVLQLKSADDAKRLQAKLTQCAADSRPLAGDEPEAKDEAKDGKEEKDKE